MTMATVQMVDQVRARLGPVGVWFGALSAVPATVERAVAAEIERLGYGSLWAPERIGGKEAFAHQGILLSATDHLATGTGIANIWSRHPAAMQGGAATLADAYPGRFVLGIGVSHGPIVNRSGFTYERPLQRMTDYLDGMDRSSGEAPQAATPAPRVLAALRPRMLELARDRADGAHPYFVPVEHTAAARGRLGPDKLLIPEQAVVLDPDTERARATGRQHMATYLRLPNYVNNLRALGYGDDDLADGGSDRLVDAIVARGDVDAVAARVRAHLDAGADHVLVQPLAADADRALAALRALAPAVLGRGVP